MASPGNKDFSISQSESKVVTVEEVALMTSGRYTLTVDQGNNILGTYLKDINYAFNGLLTKTVMSCTFVQCNMLV